MGSPQPLNLLLTQPSSGLGPNTWAKGLRGSGQSLLAWGNRGPGATEGPGPQPHGAHPSLPGPVGDPGTRTQGPVCAAAWQALGALPDASRSRSESLTLSELPTASLSTVPRKATDHSPQDHSPGVTPAPRSLTVSLGVTCTCPRGSKEGTVRLPVLAALRPPLLSGSDLSFI